MITILSATNRPDSFTRKVALIYHELARAEGLEATLFSLEDIPDNLVGPAMYEKKRSPALEKIQQEILVPTRKFFFITPEYNGSFPGILKTFIDACDIPPCFHGKKACLAGVSDGRSGNIRGIDQFTCILNHIKMFVLPNKVYLPNIEEALDAAGKLLHPKTISVVKRQIHEFLQWQ